LNTSTRPDFRAHQRRRKTLLPDGAHLQKIVAEPRANPRKRIDHFFREATPSHARASLHSSGDRIYLCQTPIAPRIAEGAVRAAEWLAGKTGFFEFRKYGVSLGWPCKRSLESYLSSCTPGCGTARYPFSRTGDRRKRLQIWSLAVRSGMISWFLRHGEILPSITIWFAYRRHSEVVADASRSSAQLHRRRSCSQRRTAARPG